MSLGLPVRRLTGQSSVYLVGKIHARSRVHPLEAAETARASHRAFPPLHGVPPAARLRSQSQADRSPVAASARVAPSAGGRSPARQRCADGHGPRQRAPSLAVRPDGLASRTAAPAIPFGLVIVGIRVPSGRDSGPRFVVCFISPQRRTRARACTGRPGHGRGTEPDPRRPRGPRKLHRDSARMVGAGREARRRSLNSL
jgi:hypothetical protein